MLPDSPPATDVADRAAILAEEATEQAGQAAQAQDAFFQMMDNEDLAPSAGLRIETHSRSRRSPTATRSRST